MSRRSPALHRRVISRVRSGRAVDRGDDGPGVGRDPWGAVGVDAEVHQAVAQQTGDGVLDVLPSGPEQLPEHRRAPGQPGFAVGVPTGEVVLGGEQQFEKCAVEDAVVPRRSADAYQHLVQVDTIEHARSAPLARLALLALFALLLRPGTIHGLQGRGRPPFCVMIALLTLTPAQLMETYLTEVVVNGRLDLIDEIARPDMVDEANQAFGGPPGRAGFVAHVVGFRRNVSDVALTIDRIVAGTDEVMGWWSFSGVHVGPWLNQKPTGEPISGTAFSFFDLVEGQISRYRVWLHAALAQPVVFDSSRPAVPGR